MIPQEKHEAFCKEWLDCSGKRLPAFAYLVDAAMNEYGDFLQKEGFTFFAAMQMIEHEHPIGIAILCEASARNKCEELYLILSVCAIIAGKDVPGEKESVIGICDNLLKSSAFLKLPIIRALSEGAVPTVNPMVKMMCLALTHDTATVAQRLSQR